MRCTRIAHQFHPPVSLADHSSPPAAGRRQVAVVVGGSSGVGLHAALALREHGMRVLLLCRNMRRADEAVATQFRAPIATVAAAPPIPDVDVVECDLASLASMRHAARQVRRTASQGVDLVLHSVSVAHIAERRLTTDGFELQVGVNFLSRFAMTGLLLPAILKAPNPRVVSVNTQRWSRLFSPQYTGAAQFKPYTWFYRDLLAHRRANVMNLLFVRELARRYPRITAVSARPGTVFGASPHGPRLDFIDPAPVLFAAQQNTVLSGEYVAPRWYVPLVRHSFGPPTVAKTPTNAFASQKLLWQHAVEATGVDYCGSGVTTWGDTAVEVAHATATAMTEAAQKLSARTASVVDSSVVEASSLGSRVASQLASTVVSRSSAFTVGAPGASELKPPVLPGGGGAEEVRTRPPFS